MKALVCQPNLAGFLTAVYEVYYGETDTEIIYSDSQMCTLFDEWKEVDEDIEKARRVRAGIIKKGGKKAFDAVSDAYRSCNTEKEQIIFLYLKLLFKHGYGTQHMYSNADVIAFNDVVQKVWHEIHRLSAFIRLQEMSNGIYYGYYSSDNDILERLMPHYIQTFNTMNFILHDYKRKKMAYFDGQVHYMLAPERLEIELSEKEQLFQSLWKQYHKNVTIKERENLRQQGQFLPKKYRHFMNEF